jgi:hypothetical protein
MERVGPEWRTMPADEWVARNGHTVVVFGWGDYTFPTPEFNAWMRELEVYLMGDWDVVRELRRRYLTSEQIAEAEAYERDPL